MKKSLKVLLALFLVASMTLSMCTVWAADDKVEIKFSVGDSTLSVNGKDVTVTTPYVVDGTTLVPARVITEAFGAEVLWDDPTQTVSINYSEVVIKLTIGNKTAYVNDTAIELLAAPELTNSTTMLPLRFITESFGADVTYDEKTEEITVTKEMTISNSIKDYSLILKRSDKSFVGDSYMGWSMSHSPMLSLNYRSFDGMDNYFLNDDKTGGIDVVAVFFNDDETIDDIYDNYRLQSKEYSVSNLEKSKSPSGVDYCIIEYSTADGYFESRTYIKDHKGFTVATYLDSQDSTREDFADLKEISATFDMRFNADNTEDLSDVKADGTHTYTSDYLALNVDIPGYLYLMESSKKENEVRFYDLNEKNPVTSVSICLYSAYDGHDAKYWAENDYIYNKSIINAEYSSFNPVRDIMIAGKMAYVYDYTETHGEYNEVTYDLFFDVGDYFYNISVSGREDSVERPRSAIFQSMKFKEIDVNKVGKLIRTNYNEEEKYKKHEIKSGNIEFEAPSSWIVVDETRDGIMLSEENGLRALTVSYVVRGDNNITTISSLAYEAYDSMKEDSTITLVDEYPLKVSVGGRTAYLVKSVVDNGDTKMCVYTYVVDWSKKVGAIQFVVPQSIDGAATKKLLDTILSSFKITKLDIL